MPDMFDGIIRTVAHFADDFIEDREHCEICGRKLKFGLCSDCDQP